MLGTIKRTAVAVTVAGVVALGGAAAASAGTATVTSGGSVAATMRLVFSGTVPLNCTSSTVAATVASGSYIGTPALVSGDVQLGINSCAGPMSIPYLFSCTNTAQLGITGDTVGAVTPAVLRNVSCVMSMPAIGCTATLSGSVGASYSNAGTVTVIAPAGQSLAISGSGCPGFIPNGPVVVGSPGAGSTSVTNLTYVLGAVKPQIAASGF